MIEVCNKIQPSSAQWIKRYKANSKMHVRDIPKQLYNNPQTTLASLKRTHPSLDLQPGKSDKHFFAVIVHIGKDAHGPDESRLCDSITRLM
jgi:hypothetical protein